MANPLSALLVTPFLLKLLPFLVKLYFKTEAQLGCTDETWEPTYDYIIVGSGPAGSVLANRLSEDPHRTVLLIESGPTFHKLAEVPGLEILFPGTAYTDSYKTVAQEKSCFGMPKRQCQFSFGRGLGGSTNIDTGIYTRGSPQEYDSWTKLGLRNWRYELNVPYFQMIEKKGSYYDATYHGSPSVIPIEPDPFENLVTRTMKSGAKELNIPSDGYYSGAYLSTPMMIQKGGSRYSAYRSYVEPIKSRPNLRIVTCAQVTKINVFNYRAVSVTVDRHGSVDTIHANKEIIISGDPISTPKLLMLSGIGPKKLLIKHNISPVMPLEGVGENLVSPICTFALNYALKDMKESELYQDFDLDNIMRYENNGTGRFATTGFDVIGQFPSQVYGYNETGHWPDLQLMLYTGGLVTKDGIWAQRKYGMDHRTWKTVFHPYVNSPSFTLMVCLARPLSRGVVEITSSHHSGPMMINPRYNDHPTDLQAITNGLKLALKLGNTQALRAIGSRIYRSVIPSCREYAIYSDPYLACAAQTLVFPSTYMAGTCRMGHPEDPMSVVNPQLQVKGVNGLRIADSSVLPTRPALSSAPEYLIGEKLFGYLTNRKPPIYAIDNSRPVSKPY